MSVQSAATMGASRNRIGAYTRGPASWADLAVRVDRGRNVLIPFLVGAVSRPAKRACARGWEFLYIFPYIPFRISYLCFC